MNPGTADLSIRRQGSGFPKPLCSACNELDLEEMLSGERNERSMGLLSDYNDPNCPFCNLLSQSISLAWGADWDSASLCSASSPAPRLFIQSRSPLSVKRHGRTEYPQPCLLIAINQKPPSFHRNRAPLREIDGVKDRYIIAEIESLPGDAVAHEACFLPRRDVGGQVNVQLVKKWLEECRKHRHSNKTVRGQEDILFDPEHSFRLIDVVDECLVQRAEKCEYVALSYVWGRIPTILFPGDDPEVVPILLTVQNNVNYLSVPKVLSLPQEASLMSGKIPRTVRDAMELTRKIGMRYLWVDTLCIIQNNPEDKARLIGRMDDVYDTAALTIIAAAGSDADAGLRGISPRMGCLIEPARITDLSDDGRTLNLSLRPPSLCEEVRGSTWNTRGWTFQEQCLSQRCLYFTAEETFFNCAQVQWREAYDYGEGKSEVFDVQVRTGPPWWSPKLRRDLDPTPYYYLGGASKKLDIQEYQKAVQDYGRKNLTFPQDVLNAFEGIFNRFNRAGDASALTIRQTQGIPAHLLVYAILWIPSDDSQKRICKPNEAGETVEQFSTWSWASWIGPVDFVFADSLWLSRNISQALIKHVPVYALIPSWQYGDSSQNFWSHGIWKAACEPESNMTKHDSEQASRAKSYLRDRLGIDVDGVLNQPPSEVPPRLGCGELGFLGPYLPASEFCISVTGKRDGSLQVSTHHHGKFRFDGQVERVDELVGVVAADTITKPPDTQSTFLGLVTRDGISSRVGIGYVYYSQEPSALKPKWQYKYFKVQ
ncbi:HET-domain-containing protein [Cryphonectria parasitica EP155]|uniref:HET-domain-containing protein n=1 Tax=Cryphonectria parasitica (strain ATCC 38755 / EP155) TaxID=660469 RepID=A0A9P4Y128_CRYP1|nr:HET-domain-containing protein [Cryphonectria parasitica EP155]KAF3764591.1 HET-domain-containing protein [Cryphonectria parasitica EP155]